MSNSNQIGLDSYALQMARVDTRLTAFERVHDRELQARNPLSRFVLHGIAKYRHWQVVGEAQL
ncbi:MAG TPA: hypothetical protein VLE74_04085, partial [Candidatus Saccharimonadales bacterium]|nr:hypothetical protein [Candidatus Saccharimonadales bacterium]